MKTLTIVEAFTIAPRFVENLAKEKGLTVSEVCDLIESGNVQITEEEIERIVNIPIVYADPPRFIIHKKTRSCPSKTSCNIWFTEAGIKDRYREYYDSYEEAMEVAEILSEYNPVGYTVSQLEA